jgi:hypothetical protein
MPCCSGVEKGDEAKKQPGKLKKGGDVRIRHTTPCAGKKRKGNL